MATSPLRIAVGVATASRGELVKQTIGLLRNQTRIPDLLLACPLVSDKVSDRDFPNLPFPIVVATGPCGLCAQRNDILARAADCDVVVFFDDDFLPERHYLEQLEQIFQSEKDVVGVTGKVLADGVTGPGLSLEQGLKILQKENWDRRGGSRPVYGLYGCNMAFRMDCVRDNQLRFDENLPLYGWQEDMDFAHQVAQCGRLVQNDLLRGVHLGVKAGRSVGVRLGYSQIANPVYLTKKGTMSWRHARWLMSRNIAANLARSVIPEPWVDRRGRLKGNVLALLDVLRGKASPARILQL